ncbi:MAG: glycosyl transferase (group I), partial [Thermodesulfobacteriota bacterium]|nr:glycosyl transferase (group I) [Thermodesulfobacteriota bacterium]
MKILYLSHRIPYPPNKGDKIRSFNEIKHLSSTHAIDLACLTDDPADLKYDRDLKKFCKKICVVSLRPLNAKAKSFVSLASNRPLSVGYFYSQALQDNINSWLASNTYDAIICFSSPMAEYLFRAPALSSRLNSRDKGMRITSTQNPEPRTQNPVLIMDFCDVDSDKWRQYSLDSAFPLNLIYRIESSLLLRYEKKINQQFDHSVFISLKEAELFQSLYPEA